MPVFKFPKNPTDGQVYISDGKTWIYNATKGIWSNPPAKSITEIFNTINTDMIPDIDSSYDLGSPSKRWKDLYLSGDTIYLGSIKLKEENDTLMMEDSTGTVHDMMNMAGSSKISISDEPPEDPSSGDVWWKNLGLEGGLFVYYEDGDSGQWVDVSTSSFSSIQGSPVVLSAVESNITPITGENFDIGSNTKRFRDLYISGALNVGTTQLSDIKMSQWDAAYNWGDHSLAGYLTPPSLNGYATETFVESSIISAALGGLYDVLVLRGSIGVGAEYQLLPTTYNSGWSFRVVTEGTYAGKICEVGDLLIATQTRTGSGGQNSDWIVIQANIENSVSGPVASIDGNIVAFDGVLGREIKDTGINMSQFNIANWNQSYGWGDHAEAGYISGVASVGVGGTGITSFDTGDIIFSLSDDNLSRLPIGTTGQILTAGGNGLPVWQTSPSPTREEVEEFAVAMAIALG